MCILVHGYVSKYLAQVIFGSGLEGRVCHGREFVAIGKLWSGIRETWMLAHHFLGPFDSVQNPSPFDGASHIQGGSFLLSEASLKMPSQMPR